MTLLTFYDAVTVGNIPADAVAVGAYVDGSFANETAVRDRFPTARILTITVRGIVGPNACDCEPGDLTDAQAISWVEASLAAGIWRPCVYADLSHWEDGLLAALEKYGDGIRRWVAHYDGVPDVPAGYDAKQFSTGNFDTNVCLVTFFAPPPPPPEPPTHYNWFDVGPFSSQWGSLNERNLVEHYDGAKLHPAKYEEYLKLYLEPRLKFLADRVAYVAIHDPYKGKPSWGKYHRGWRYQEILRRSRGE